LLSSVIAGGFDYITQVAFFRYRRQGEVAPVLTFEMQHL